MAAIRQTHPSVPTSNSPPIPEWASHFWYAMRVGALQANDKLTDEEAASLVAWFQAFTVVLPCAECRAKYVLDWAAEPFTVVQAKDTVAAMKWVEDLRIKIEGQTKSTKAVAAAAPAPAPAPPAAPALRTARSAVAARQPLAKTPPAVVPAVARSVAPVRSAAVATPRAIAAPSPVYAKSASGDAMQRQVAIKSALQQSAANRAGPRGCNCGSRRS
jgi:hypothetical protein